MNALKQISVLGMCLFSASVLLADPRAPEPDPVTVDAPMCMSWNLNWIVHRFDIHAKKWQTYRSPEAALPTHSGAIPRIGRHGAAVLDRDRNSSGWYFDFEAEKWSEIPKSPLVTDRNNLDKIQMAIIGRRIVAWGYKKEGPQGAVYDPDTRKWAAIAGAPIVVRYRATTTVIGSKLFVWHGYGPLTPPPYRRFGPLWDGAIYDIAGDRWEKIDEPAFNVGGYGIAGDVWRDRFVVVGDKRGKEKRVGGAIYDPEMRTWETISATPGNFGTNAARAVVGDRLFVWSGLGGAPNNEVYTHEGAVYDFNKRRWTAIAEAPIEPRSLAFSHVLGSRVMVWGGWVDESGPDRFVASGAIYDLARDTWEEIPELPTDVPMPLHPGW